MESKRTTRASSQDVATRRGTRKSPGRKRSPSPIIEENISPKPRARGRPKSASRNEASKPTPKSPKKTSKTPAAATATAETKKSPPSPKKSPRGRGAAAAVKSTTTASTISSTSTAKTLTLSASAELKGRLRASMTPMTRSISRSMSRSVYDREFSDTEENDDDRPASSASFDRRSMSRQPQDRLVRSTWGALLALLLTTVVPLALTLACTSPGCSHTLDTVKRLLWQCSTWYDAQATAVYVLFIAAVTLISAVPLGRVVEIPRGEDDFQSYMFNGFGTCALAIIAVICSDNKVDSLQFIYKNYTHLCVLSVLTAIIVAIGAFVRARSQPNELLNAYARTQKPFCDFLIGREVSPLWFNRIDAKLVFYRISVITALLINVVFLTKTIELPPTVPLSELNATSVWAFITGIRADVAPTAAASMVLLYCLDLLIFEHHLSSSFHVQYEGFGALVLLRLAAFPFMISAVPKFVLENVTRAPWWIVSIMATIFIVGLTMKRCADRIKYAYRMNAQDPKFENLDTIATFQGQGIIADSLWKFVRHPNHLGEMLIYCAFLPLLCVRFSWAPLVAVLYLIGMIAHHAGRVDQRSSFKYNSAWAQYSKIVPNLLVPRVY